MFEPVLHLARRLKAFSFRGVDRLFEVLPTATFSHDLSSHAQLAEEDGVFAGAGHRIQQLAG